MKIFGREPTVWLQAISAVLALVVSFGLDWLTDDQAALVIAVVSAVVSALNAWMVKPVSPAVFTGVVTAGAALLAAYGLDFTQEQIGAVSATLTVLMTLLLRNSVTPEADPQPGGGVPEAVAGPGTPTPRV